jgi:hypothetical protein
MAWLTEAVPLYLNDQADEAFEAIVPEFNFQLHANGSYNKTRYKQEKQRGSFMHKAIPGNGVSILASPAHFLISEYLHRSLVLCGIRPSLDPLANHSTEGPMP